jgi:hypothetical protein
LLLWEASRPWWGTSARWGSCISMGWTFLAVKSGALH